MTSVGDVAVECLIVDSAYSVEFAVAAAVAVVLDVDRLPRDAADSWSVVVAAAADMSDLIGSCWGLESESRLRDYSHQESGWHVPWVDQVVVYKDCSFVDCASRHLYRSHRHFDTPGMSDWNHIAARNVPQAGLAGGQDVMLVSSYLRSARNFVERLPNIRQQASVHGDRLAVPPNDHH